MAAVIPQKIIPTTMVRRMTETLDIRVGPEDFDLGAEYRRLCAAAPGAGAVVTFCGLVREFYQSDDGDPVRELRLEHYPGMTEKSILDIARRAQRRWELLAVRIIHRIGALRPGEQIVFAGVAAHHRAEAFQAADFIMDYLKSQAPFWKKQLAGSGGGWVGIRDSDRDAIGRWRSAGD